MYCTLVEQQRPSSPTAHSPLFITVVADWEAKVFPNNLVIPAHVANGLQQFPASTCQPHTVTRDACNVTIQHKHMKLYSPAIQVCLVWLYKNVDR